MKYARLGRSGLQVSRLCLGTMMFGARTDEAESRRIVDEARGAGINFIDTADAYASGASEEITGRAIKAERSHWVLATKIANAPAAGPNLGGLSRRWMIPAVEACLTRLATDTIDILYFHKEDTATPLAESVHAVADLIRQGKIRHFGVSNFRAWRVAEICRLCDELGIDRPVVSQPYYNAMNRMPEVEHLPACAHFGLGVVPYSPLARGILTAKYQPGEKPDPGSRAGTGDKRMMQTEWRPESIAAAQRFLAHATERGTSVIAFATAWVLANPIITGVIAGPRTLEQWRSYLPALELEIGPQDEAFVDALVPPGHPSTPGYSDPAYPIEGRPVGQG
jgi:aryl-alcohol dehydrogenase-like predicted oxidoreductase